MDSHGFVVAAALILILLWYHHDIISTLLTGFWVGDAEFLKSAGLDSFVFYISKGTLLSQSRGCYLLMMSEGEVVLNHPTAACLQSSSLFSFGMSPKYFRLTFEEQPEIIPQQLTLKLDPRVGKLVLRDDQTIYGIFYRDGSQTELAFAT